MRPILLASNSATRRQILQNAGIPFESQPPRIDEEMVKASLLADGIGPRDLADALADFKARKVAAQHPDALVIGGDQTAELDGEVLSKPVGRADAAAQLAALSGGVHKLHAAVVVYDLGKPVWRHVSTVRLTMRPLGNRFIESYLDRNWPDISECVGSYKLEAEGVRLFSRVDGDFFAVLGLPLIELCGYLTMIGVIEG